MSDPPRRSRGAHRQHPTAWRRVATQWLRGIGLLMIGGILLAAARGLAAKESSNHEPSQPKNDLLFRYDAGGRRDPFVALVRDGRLVGATTTGQHVELSKPVLYGIVWDPEGRSLALVNDTEVTVGDSVGSYKVAEIRRDAVVLTGASGEPVVLEMMFDTPPPQKLGPRPTKGGEGR